MSIGGTIHTNLFTYSLCVAIELPIGRYRCSR